MAMNSPPEAKGLPPEQPQGQEAVESTWPLLGTQDIASSQDEQLFQVFLGLSLTITETG